MVAGWFNSTLSFNAMLQVKNENNKKNK